MTIVRDILKPCANEVEACILPLHARFPPFEELVASVWSRVQGLGPKQGLGGRVSCSEGSCKNIGPLKKENVVYVGFKQFGGWSVGGSIIFYPSRWAGGAPIHDCYRGGGQ